MNCLLKVCFAVEPKGTMTCARTYFLQNGCVPILSSDTAKKSSVVHSKDLRYSLFLLERSKAPVYLFMCYMD